MIHGVTIRVASQMRKATTKRTSPARATSAPRAASRDTPSTRSSRNSRRCAVCSTAKAHPHLSDRAPHLAQLRAVGVDPDLLCSARDVAENRLLHGGPAGGLLQRRDVEVGRALEIMLLPDVRA